MAAGKGSAASIYATVDGAEGKDLQSMDASAKADQSKPEGAFSDSGTASDTSSASSNISTPTATTFNTSAFKPTEGACNLDGQPKSSARPLLDRLDLHATYTDPPAPSPAGSPPMTPARRRLRELDYEAATRSPGSRSVNIALTSPSTTRTPLAATAPLPETPLKHGQDAPSIATPTRASIVERRQAPAMPPLSPPSREASQDRAPRGLGLGLTPTKQSSNAFFGGPVSPAINRADARVPTVPSSRTRVLDFDVTSTTDEDDSLSLSSQDIESSILIAAPSAILTSTTCAAPNTKLGQPNANGDSASRDLEGMLTRVRDARESCAKTVRGSGASRWADPEPVTRLPHNESNEAEAATATLLSRMALSTGSSSDISKRVEPSRREQPNATKGRGFDSSVDKIILPTPKGRESPLLLSTRYPLPPSTNPAEPLYPSSTAVAKTPVLESSVVFGGQSAKGLTSQVRNDSMLVGTQVTSSDPVSDDSLTPERRSSLGNIGDDRGLKASPATSSKPLESRSVAALMPHFDWAEDDEDEDELPDLDGWGVTLPQTPNSSSALPEPASPSPHGLSSKSTSVLVPAVPPTDVTASSQQQNIRPRKPSSRKQKGEHRTDSQALAPILQSNLGGIRIAGVASSPASALPPSSSQGAMPSAPPRRELLPSSSSGDASHIIEPAAARGHRGRGGSGPGSGAWLHDMVQGPCPPKRTERQKPQLREGGAFARLTKGIVGVKAGGTATNGEKKTTTVAAAALIPSVTSVSPPRNAPTGPAASGAGMAPKGNGSSKGRGQSSPRKASQAKTPTKM